MSETKIRPAGFGTQPDVIVQPPLVNILHVTDFHFHSLENDERAAQRERANRDLLSTLGRIVAESRRSSNNESEGILEDWRPAIVAVTGDIAYEASSNDYLAAADFFAKMADVLGLHHSAFIFCPGNHDRQLRLARGIHYPPGADKSDEWLSKTGLCRSESGTVEDIDTPALVAPFGHFQKFCRDFGSMRPERLPGIEYLTGLCTFKSEELRIDFLVLNSSWFSVPGGKDMRNLWLGLPLVEWLVDSEVDRLPPGRPVRIGLFHHPREWLHEEEHDSYGSRPNTYRLVARDCDLILNGHTHGALEPPTQAHNTAQVFTGGAAYAGGRYRNNFSILQLNLDDRSVRRRGFEYDPRTPAWEEKAGAHGTYLLPERASPGNPVLTVDDLAGLWKGVYWIEEGSRRRAVQTIRLQAHSEQDANSSPRFVSASHDSIPSELDLDGQLEDGYFSGYWWHQAEVSENKRHGVFHLVLLDKGNEISGRWLGYDKNGEVRSGKWRFLREERL